MYHCAQRQDVFYPLNRALRSVGIRVSEFSLVLGNGRWGRSRIRGRRVVVGGALGRTRCEWKVFVKGWSSASTSLIITITFAKIFSSTFSTSRILFTFLAVIIRSPLFSGQFHLLNILAFLGKHIRGKFSDTFFHHSQMFYIIVSLKCSVASVEFQEDCTRRPNVDRKRPSQA